MLKRDIGWLVLTIFLFTTGMVHHYVDNPSKPWAERAFIDGLWILGISAVEFLIAMLAIWLHKRLHPPLYTAIYNGPKCRKRMTS